MKTKPMWQQLSETRHENEAVLAAVRDGAYDIAEIARRTGMTQFRTAIVLRRVRDCGLLR